MGNRGTPIGMFMTKERAILITPKQMKELRNSKKWIPRKEVDVLEGSTGLVFLQPQDSIFQKSGLVLMYKQTKLKTRDGKEEG